LVIQTSLHYDARSEKHQITIYVLAYTYTNDRKTCRVDGHEYYTDAVNMLCVTNWGAQLSVPL